MCRLILKSNIYRTKYEEDICENRTLSRIAELEEKGEWVNITDHRKLTSQSEEPIFIDDLKRAARWSKLIETAAKIGKDWQIERKYRRLLSKKVIGGVRKAVKDKVTIFRIKFRKFRPRDEFFLHGELHIILKFKVI